ncbi:hypothetical protein HYQ46_005744 [Verticillium longisporum]|nr:hypothetical protein HYQ46_005744 [Verticillium longisporum]
MNEDPPGKLVDDEMVGHEVNQLLTVRRAKMLDGENGPILDIDLVRSMSVRGSWNNLSDSRLVTCLYMLSFMFWTQVWSFLRSTVPSSVTGI